MSTKMGIVVYRAPYRKVFSAIFRERVFQQPRLITSVSRHDDLE
jgi:hypothetical protein